MSRLATRLCGRSTCAAALTLVLALVLTLAATLAPMLAAVPASAAPLNGLTLIAANPGNHETITFPPDHVSLTFDRRLGDAATIAIAVSAPGGTRVERGPITVEGAVASIRLRRGLGNGDYTVGFVVARTGGGSISGSLIFEVQLPPPHSKVTDPPEVIARALAKLQSPSPSPAHRRADHPVRRGRRSAPASPVGTPSAAAAPAPDTPSWWSDSTVIAIGAVLLLVLAGAAVFVPGRRDDD